MLALTPQPAKVDFGLFVRPFQDEAWHGIIIILIMILITLLVPYGLISFYENTQGKTLYSFYYWSSRLGFSLYKMLQPSHHFILKALTLLSLLHGSFLSLSTPTMGEL